MAQPAAVHQQYTRQDTLRGSITPERAWWNALHYHITVEPDYKNKSISGTNVITCMALSKGQRLQIDLQEPMKLTAVTHDQQPLKYTRKGNVYYVDLEKQADSGAVFQLRLRFAGMPRVAVNPPWDGGWIWERDEKGNPWMSVACQGLGASVWYPCKDHQADEPDSARLTIIAPAGLMAVGNGRLTDSAALNGGRHSYTWTVVNPINNYNIIPYIGKYVNWAETYDGEKGKLNLSYWVLQQNLSKAKEQFKQVPLMLKCFEGWFGPYPFYADGYKLVESPHLGMEHQSAVAYGNKYQNGYLGRDLSGTGWGKKWDFIIVHESGHEWFGNNITTKDLADMWVHEGFTNYSESLFTECQYGKKAGEEYCIGTQKNIRNDIPVIGPYGVNKEGSGDMYYKAGNMVNMIRQIINDDQKFRSILRGLNKDFYHQTVTSAQVEQYISSHSGRDFSKVFDQYLRTTQVPELQYFTAGDSVQYRWANCIPGFNMPVRINAGTSIWLTPGTEWQATNTGQSSFTIDPNFYVRSRKM